MAMQTGDVVRGLREIESDMRELLEKAHKLYVNSSHDTACQVYNEVCKADEKIYRAIKKLVLS